MENLEVLDKLWTIIQDRKKNPKEGSYTCELFENPDEILDKIREEIGEIESAVRDGRREGKDSIGWESADLLYHLLVLLEANDVDFDDVLEELRSRMK